MGVGRKGESMRRAVELLVQLDEERQPRRVDERQAGDVEHQIAGQLARDGREAVSQGWGACAVQLSADDDARPAVQFVHPRSSMP